MADAWNPAQYEKFREERKQPFRDLLALVRPRPGMRVLDLGCGTGELTLELHEALFAAETTGIDASEAMLAKAPRREGLRFVRARVEETALAGPLDLVFSNAALHFVGDHASLFRRAFEALAPGGQLAVQVPANDGHLSHQTAFALAREEFGAELGGYVRRPELLSAVEYAQLLHRLGFAEQSVRLQIYGHRLSSREGVVEWVRGALLTDYEQRLAPADQARFLARYRERLLAQLPDERPFFYTYPRILLWAQKEAGTQ